MTVDATHATTTVLFNETGRTALALTDPMGNLYEYLYHNKGNLTTTLLPNCTAVAYGYDPLGNQTVQVDPLGNSITSTYDGSFSTLWQA